MVVNKTRKIINTSMIEIPRYQREIRDGRVKHIVDNFEEIQAELPKVSWRDNKYYMFDGQHTTEARIIMNGGNDLDIECEVYTGLTEKDEADLFVKLNSNKKPVTFNEKMKSNYISGNEDAVEIINIITNMGINISYTSTASKPNTVGALNKATQIYTKGGQEALKWVLSVAKSAWGEDKYGMSGAILGGLYVVYNTYNDDKRFLKEEFVRVMSMESPNVIIREGRELSIGGDKRFAKRMIERYNKKSSRKLRVAKLEA